MTYRSLKISDEWLDSEASTSISTTNIFSISARKLVLFENSWLNRISRPDFPEDTRKASKIIAFLRSCKTWYAIKSYWKLMLYEIILKFIVYLIPKHLMSSRKSINGANLKTTSLGIKLTSVPSPWQGRQSATPSRISQNCWVVEAFLPSAMAAPAFSISSLQPEQNIDIIGGPSFSKRA